MAQKRVLTIQDISCTGRCSITVALPVLSACGLETAIVPTSILSTHTGGFTGFTHHDLTDDLAGIRKHWETLDLHFDAIYTGFLANEKQVDETLAFIKSFKKEDTKLYVDPAMADGGKLYSIISPEFVEKMKELVAMADVVVPNMTEAFFLLNQEYHKGPYVKDEVELMAKNLRELGAKQVVITGPYYDESTIGCLTYDGIEFGFHSNQKIDGEFCGTGDVFMSALLGANMKGHSLEQSSAIAAKYVFESIKRTVEEKRDLRYGVNFEEGMLDFIQSL